MFLLRMNLLYFVIQYHCYGSLVLDVYRRFCPNTKFCSNQSRVTDHIVFSDDQVPCCFPCYCDPQCWIFSDCCPDAEIPIGNIMNSKASCQFAHYLSDSLRKDQIGAFLAEKYIIQDKCPFNSTGNIADKCAEIFDDIPSLEDISVVSDSSHLSMVYKNKYCAECHGVKNVTRWKARTGTSNLSKNTLFKNITHFRMYEHLLNHNEIQFLPTPEIPARTIHCSLTSLEKCYNGTTHLGLNVHQECLKSDAPRYHPNDNPMTSSHHNLFCYLCVTSKLEPDQQICNAFINDNDERQTSMHLLIDLRPEDFRISSTVNNKDTTGLCTGEEIYDKIHDRCRRLHCAWYAPLSGNKCVFLGKVVPGIRLSAILLLIVDSPLNKTKDEITTEEVRDLERAIQRHTKLFKCPFKVIMITKLIPKQSNYNGCFRIHIARTITHRCPFQFLVYRLAETLSLSWQQNLNFGNRSFDVMTKINFQPLRNRHGDIEYLDDYDLFTTTLHSRGNMFIKYVASANLEMFPCPHILLNVSEYNMLLYNDLNINNTITETPLTTNLYEGFYAISKSEMVVCSTAFLKMVNQATSNLAETKLALFVSISKFINYL